MGCRGPGPWHRKAWTSRGGALGRNFRCMISAQVIEKEHSEEATAVHKPVTVVARPGRKLLTN